MARKRKAELDTPAVTDTRLLAPVRAADRVVPHARGLLIDPARGGRRLAWMATIGIALAGVFLFSSGLSSFWAVTSRALTAVLAVVFATGSALVLWVVRRHGHDVRWVQGTALLYEVFAAASMALLVNRLPWPDIRALPSWSPVAVWVLVFPLIVPTRPRWNLAASLAAAMTDPLSLFSLAAVDYVSLPSPELMLHRFVPNALAVIPSVILAVHFERVAAALSEARQLGSYQLVELLGRGGMGEVWRAKHHLLARPAAIKLVRADALGGSVEQRRVLVERFEQEAQITSGLRSPHTIAVYDFGLSQSGQFYYVMELLDGIDLARLVQRFGPQPAARVVHLLRQACHSVHEVHQAGLIHRDIKPANLFACRYGADLDFLKVLDFGLVKVVEAGRAPGSADPTLGDILVGTPAFMAPEIAAEGARPDWRADIYSLGCVAYWLLTGRLVFAADSPAAMLRKHSAEPPAPASVISELPIPEGLDALVTACLAKDPARRPQSARELTERLGALGLDAAWSEEHRAEWWQRHLPAAHSAVTALVG